MVIKVLSIFTSGFRVSAGDIDGRAGGSVQRRLCSYRHCQLSRLGDS
jgi:hypothetical protein